MNEHPPFFEIRMRDREGRWFVMEVEGWRFRKTTAAFIGGGEMSFGWRSGEDLPEGHAAVMFQGPLHRIADEESAVLDSEIDNPPYSTDW